MASGDATWVWIRGKGGKERNLFLSSDARLAIQRYLAERHDSAAALFISHGPFGNAETAIATKTMWAIVNDACKAVFGVDDNGRPLRRAGPHAFRHLRAQLYSDEGLSITSLQATLGHASIETTRRTYAPKTPNPKLADELGTYGLPSAEVIARGEQALRRHQDASKEG